MKTFSSMRVYSSLMRVNSRQIFQSSSLPFNTNMSFTSYSSTSVRLFSTLPPGMGGGAGGPVSQTGGAAPHPAMFKSVPAIYKDCLKLINHVAGRTTKGDAVRESVRQQFKANSSETDPETIQEMKESALFALENYLILHAQSQLRHKDTNASPLDDQMVSFDDDSDEYEYNEFEFEKERAKKDQKEGVPQFTEDGGVEVNLRR